ncbi:MAG TPA: amidohydrolase family protein, partial [Pyrinomonadaceae bacterium]|nr:amidohydrolase family protein [Pyrinomonadaceae bacterium]
RFAALLARNSGSGGPFVQPQRLIETATLGGARALGLESEIGSLEPGKQADLIVVGLGRVAQQPVHDVHSTLVFATGARDVRLTVVGGDEIARDGATLSVDAGEIGSRFGALRQK